MHACMLDYLVLVFLFILSPKKPMNILHLHPTTSSKTCTFFSRGSLHFLPHQPKKREMVIAHGSCKKEEKPYVLHFLFGVIHYYYYYILSEFVFFYSYASFYSTMLAYMNNNTYAFLQGVHALQ